MTQSKKVGLRTASQARLFQDAARRGQWQAYLWVRHRQMRQKPAICLDPFDNVSAFMRVSLHINTQKYQLLTKAVADRMASSLPLTWAVPTLFSFSFVCQANALGRLVFCDRCRDRPKRAALQAGAAAQSQRKTSKNIFEKTARGSPGEPVQA